MTLQCQTIFYAMNSFNFCFEYSGTIFYNISLMSIYIFCLANAINLCGYPSFVALDPTEYIPSLIGKLLQSHHNEALPS